MILIKQLKQKVVIMSGGIKNVKGGLGQFKSLVSGHKTGLVVVHFWAAWAGQCGPMDEALKILAQDDDLDSTLFLRVEAEDEADISMEYEVAAVPTFIFFGNGKVMGRVEGAKVSQVTKLVSDGLETYSLDIPDF